MAVVRRTLEDIRRNPGRIDRARFDATTEADIRRYMIEDGENPDALPSRDLPGYVLPEAVRARLGMTQAEFAAAIRVPVATLRNWEQGRAPTRSSRSITASAGLGQSESGFAYIER